MSTVQRFAVPPPGKAAWAVLLLLAVVLPAIAVGMAFWLEPAADPGERWILAAVMAFVLLVGAGLSAAMTRRRVELAGTVLTVRAALYTRRVPVAALDPGQARVLDLREHPQLRPLLKTNGFALPGFHAGHFRLRSREPAFVLYTDPSRVLLLPVAGDKPLLLGLERPQALLQALQARQPAAG